MRTRKAPETRPWVHLDQAPLFDQSNGTRGVGNREEADDPGRDDALKLLEVGLVSSIISFGTGLR